MSVQAQLEYEARVKQRQAILAAVAGILLMVAVGVQLSGFHTKVDELTIDLITEHRRFPLDVIGAIVNAFGLVGVALTLNFMYGITKARKPELQAFIRYLALVGGIVSAVAAVIYAATIAAKASDFVNGGLQTYQQANALTKGTVLLAVPLVAQFASLLLTAGFIWISLNAMRVGLLPKMMGYAGILSGVLVLFPIGFIAGFIQGFWLLALAYLFTGRWPDGIPKAWETGEAETLPSGAELRAARVAERSGGRGGARPEKLKAPRTTIIRDDEEDDAAAVPSRTRADTPKRKRKRRR